MHGQQQEPQKRLIHHPFVKPLLQFTQSVATAIVIGGGASAINKLDSILTSINTFKTDVALVQRDITSVRTDLLTTRENQRNIRSDVELLKQSVFALQLKVDQLEKPEEARHGR